MLPLNEPIDQWCQVGGKDAVSTTITSTRKSLSMDGGLSLFRGRSHSTWLNDSATTGGRSSRGGGSNSSRWSTLRGLGVIGSNIKSAEVVPSSCSVAAENSGSEDGGISVTGGGAGSSAVATDFHVSGDNGGNAAALVEAPPPPAGVSVSTATGAATTAAAVSGFFGAEVAGRESSEREDGKGKKTPAAVISKLISALPLSKLKIVIGRWWPNHFTRGSVSRVTLPDYLPA